MHTTALVVQVGEHTAILYYSSRCHAGENLQGLLDKREAGRAKPLAMSDALASNVVANEAAVIMSLPGPWAAQVQRPRRGVSARMPGRPRGAQRGL